MVKRLGLLFLCLLMCLSVRPVSAQSTGALIELLDRNGAKTSRLVDGNKVQLRLKLTAPVKAAAQADFFVSGLASAVASCALAAGEQACTSQVFAASGWYWADDGSPRPERLIQVELNGETQAADVLVQISPRPVVMVHGFLSNWETWKAYLGPDGYLASLGLQGFAVGDGQVPGVMNTGGNADDTSGRTNSIAQNAAILKDYIQAVQARTGAEKVDLLVHSMGGMISRYYLDRVMDNENVAQVIFLGTPMAGSACVLPLAALGYLMPASLEILPDYMINTFNTQIVHRHGVPFYMVAGTLLIDPITSPCTSAPSDTVVGYDSATALQLDDIQQFPLYHGSLTSNAEVFETKVTHLLKNTPPSFAPRPDVSASAVVATPAQFSRAYSGHLAATESREVTINIDPNVTLASFSLFDSSRSLDVEVRGASGKVIVLDPVKNGLIKIIDPEMMLYLGYGFKQPKPGKWVITLKTTAQTPPGGADYALNARFDGGAVLSTSSAPTIPALGEAVNISASLELPAGGLQVSSADALVRKPDGSQVSLALTLRDGRYVASYRPDQSGLHSVEVRLAGAGADGFAIDRAAVLAFEVQPGGGEVSRARSIAVLVGILVLVLVVVLVLRGFMRRRHAG